MKVGTLGMVDTRLVPVGNEGGEIGMILNMGVDIRYNSEIKSLKSLLDQGFDVGAMSGESALPSTMPRGSTATSPT